MSLLLNDCSVQGQFATAGAFRAAIARVLQLRAVAAEVGWETRCHQNILAAWVTKDLQMRDAVGGFNTDQRRSVMLWFTKLGPFWDVAPQHDANDYLECLGFVVTDTAIGEAGFCRLRGIDERLISLSPSDWELDPVEVAYHSDLEIHEVEIPNYWEISRLLAELSKTLSPIRDWDTLASRTNHELHGLVFGDRTFEALKACPFSQASCTRIVSLLRVLDQLSRACDGEGNRTADGQELYRQFFTGERAWFSDSSDTEKDRFGNRMIFPDPEELGVSVGCTWHGKVSSQFLRVHFQWPVPAGQRIYVAYIGPKLTKN